MKQNEVFNFTYKGMGMNRDKKVPFFGGLYVKPWTCTCQLDLVPLSTSSLHLSLSNAGLIQVPIKPTAKRLWGLHHVKPTSDSIDVWMCTFDVHLRVDAWGIWDQHDT